MRIRKNLIAVAAVIAACGFLVADAGGRLALARGAGGGSKGGGSWSHGGPHREGASHNKFRDRDRDRDHFRFRRGGLQIGRDFDRFGFNRNSGGSNAFGDGFWGWGVYPYQFGYSFPYYTNYSGFNYSYPFLPANVYYTSPYGQ